MAPPAFFSMSFWNPSTQKDAPHEGPHHLLWAPPRRLRHTPSPAGAGPEGLPRIVPPARLPSRGWPRGSPGHPQTLPLPSSLSWRLVSIQPHCPVLGLSSPCPPPACALRPPLPPSPQPHLSLPASSPSQSSPSLPPSPKALQVLPGVWPPAHVLHPSQPLRFPGLTSLFSASVPLHIHFLCGDSQRSLFSNLLNPPLAMPSSSFFCDSLAPIAMASETF